MQALSQLDLVFCADLTASMQPFIRAAQQQMVSILKALAQTGRADLRVGICGYRDYSDFETTTQCYPLNADMETTRSVLQQLQAYSPEDNCDAAEAVFAGLVDAAEMDWREQSYRVIILVGDAPPHGCGASAEPYPDRWPKQDPTGLSLLQMGGKLEGSGITLFALTMSPSVLPVHDPIMKQSFAALAQSTGGTFHDAASARGAIELFQEICRRVFRDLDLDRQIYERYFQDSPNRPAPSPADYEFMAAESGFSEEDLRSSYSRLKKRKLQQ